MSISCGPLTHFDKFSIFTLLSFLISAAIIEEDNTEIGYKINNKIYSRSTDKKKTILLASLFGELRIVGWVFPTAVESGRKCGPTFKASIGLKKPYMYLDSNV